jgi:hypothetical protein
MKTFEVSCRKGDGWTGSLRVGDLRFFNGFGGQPITAADFLAQIAGQRVVNFAHGYHNKESQADDAARTVASKIEQAALGYDAMVLFSWAGGLTYAGFGMAVARTKACGAKLADLIALEVGAGARVDCVSHSLGAEVAAQALLAPGSAVGRWVALAPAIPDDSLACGGKFLAESLGVREILVSYSERDEVLQWAYPIGSGFKAALGLHGPSVSTLSAKVTGRNASQYVRGHSEAYWRSEVYECWKRWAAC